jgi:hypothetical protein
MFLAPGAHAWIDHCSNCGPKPIVEFRLWVEGSSPKTNTEVVRGGAVARDGTLLVLDSQRVATRSPCGDTGWHERTVPDIGTSPLANTTIRFEPPYALAYHDRWLMVVDIERGIVRRLAGQGYHAHTSSTGLLAYSANDTADVIVMDIASEKEVRRWPAAGRALAFSHDGSRLVIVAPHDGDSHSDLRVVRVVR